LANLGRIRDGVRTPSYDPRRLACGQAHLGLGAFSRSHPTVFTEDAIEAAGGSWGVAGVCLRTPDAALALQPQDGLYTLELRAPSPRRRVIGALRKALAARLDPDAVMAALADPRLHVVTLTVTELGYALGVDGGLDLARPDVAADLARAWPPRSVPGWLVRVLSRRQALGAGPLTILSCDNLRDNGRKLRAAVETLAERLEPALAAGLDRVASFPNTMVDAITPASDEALRARVLSATGLRDEAAVQRELFAQWVIEDAFIGPRPAWERAGAEIVPDVAGFEALKLHVLNAAHSALACLGPPRGHQYVRTAIADPELAGFLDAMVAEEIAPALAPAAVEDYWRGARRRFADPAIDHRLDQIAKDGAAKLKERLHPLILANARAGRPIRRLRAVLAAWLTGQGRTLSEAVLDPALFGAPFRDDPEVLRAMVEHAP
jgi:fructuronate reductase